MLPNKSLEATATKLLQQHDYYQKLKQLGNKKHKASLLQSKIREEIDFWNRKKSLEISQTKLLDLNKDLIFTENYLENPNQGSLVRMQELYEKYGC